MIILFKYVILTVFQKPIRLTLILITICLSGAAILASVSISDTMLKTTTNKWRSEYGYSDIVVTSRLSSPSRYFDQYKIEKYNNYYNYSVKKISASGSIGDHSFIFHGYTLDTLLKMLELQKLKGLDASHFTGNMIIVSEKYAYENKVNKGDVLTLQIDGRKVQLVVYSVFPSDGPFAYEKDDYSAIVPFEKVQALSGHLGKADTVYIGLKKGVSKTHMILRLAELYKEYKVSETYSADHVRLQTNRSAVPFVFMSVLLCLMAVYVIYIIFQNIVIERMPQIGVLRAMGAGKFNADMVVLLEGFVYGIAGGISSLGTGILFLFLLTRHLLSAEAASDVKIAVSNRHIALTMLISIGMSIIGGYLSLRKYKSMPIIGLIKQNTDNQGHFRLARPLAAVVLFIASLAVLLLLQSLNGLVIYVSLVIIIMLSFLIASPFIFRIFVLFAKRLLYSVKGIFKIVSLSIQNQRSFVIASTILAVIMSTGIIIDTINFSNSEGSREYFGRFHYEMEISAGDLTLGRLNTLTQLPGVSEVCANYYSTVTEVKGQSISIYRIHGVDTQKAPDFMDYNMSSSYDIPFEQLEKGRNILLTKTLGRIYKVKENDEIILKIYAYNGAYREVAYKISGFFDDEYTKLGRYALISQKNFAEDFQPSQYSSISVKSDDVAAALSSMQSAYRDRQAQIETVRERQESTIEESRLTISSMNWISNISMITGISGMLFIMLLSFKCRAGELAIYGAMGLPKGGIGRMLFYELLLSGVAGIFSGVVMGCIISYIALPKLIFSLQIAMRIYFSIGTILNSCFKGLLICLLSGAIGLINYSRTTLMGGLRSE